MTVTDVLVGIAAGIVLGAVIGWDEYRKARSRRRIAERQLGRLRREADDCYRREIARGGYTGPRWERQR